MNDLISRQSVLDIVDDLRDRMTVEGYCAMTERVKALPSATCGNLEKPEIPQHSEGEAADCNLDCISRQMLLEYIHGEPVGKLLCDKYNLDGLIEQFPSVQPNLQPTCNQLATDCISRQEAIDALMERFKRVPTTAIIAKDTIENLPSAQPEVLACGEGELSAQPEIKPISYKDCANAMLKMWMDNVLTDGEYNRIMDKLNKFDAERRTDGN